LPLGIDFRATDSSGKLPFDDESFDMVINRHGDFHAEEICRVLKPNGVFVTQQVGAENDREFVELLLTETPALPFPEQYLSITKEKFLKAGFEILEGQEAFGKLRFRDIGALVWFARIIEWEFPGFSVDGCLDNLYYAQELLERNGAVEAKTHRFMLVAKKKHL
jgi:SAM-dependent methyltransferase